jgi:hypothetical protein
VSLDEVETLTKTRNEQRVDGTCIEGKVDNLHVILMCGTIFNSNLRGSSVAKLQEKRQSLGEERERRNAGCRNGGKNGGEKRRTNTNRKENEKGQFDDEEDEVVDGNYPQRR